MWPPTERLPPLPTETPPSPPSWKAGIRKHASCDAAGAENDTYPTPGIENALAINRTDITLRSKGEAFT
jgi:hypothetical protein